MKLSDYLDKNKNYVVTKQPDQSNNWWFQIYRSRLNEYAAKGEFLVVVVCDAGADSQQIFALPYSRLRQVLSEARLDEHGRYLFDVKKETLDIRFRPHNLAFKGKNFLVE